MSIEELELKEAWQADPSFVNWAHEDNEADIAKWEAYFEEHPERRALGEMTKFAIVHLQNNLSVESTTPANSQAALRQLKAKLGQPTKVNPQSKPVFRLPAGLKVAASLLVLVGLSFWLYTSNTSTLGEVVQHNYATIENVVLPDGTEVTLNKNAMLSYTDDAPRSIRLDGEAFFNVSKRTKADEVFTVVTDDLQIQVLGTQFNVRTDDDQTFVYLEEGSVKLLIDGAEEIIMTPGELVNYSKKKKSISTQTAASALVHTAWKEKTIFFEDAPFSELLDSIRVLYDVEIEVQPTVDLEQSFTGGIPVRNLDIALQTLNTVYKLDIQKENSKLIIQ